MLNNSIKHLNVKHLPVCPVKHWTYALKVILIGTPEKKLLPVRPKTLRRRKITKSYSLKCKRNNVLFITLRENVTTDYIEVSKGTNNVIM